MSKEGPTMTSGFQWPHAYTARLSDGDNRPFVLENPTHGAVGPLGYLPTVNTSPRSCVLNSGLRLKTSL